MSEMCTASEAQATKFLFCVWERSTLSALSPATNDERSGKQYMSMMVAHVMGHTAKGVRDRLHVETPCQVTNITPYYAHSN